MKKCPQCGREYDGSMMFCLDDGAELLYGPGSSSEPVTAILSEPGAVGTGFPVGESSTQIYPAGGEAEPHESFGSSTERQSLSAHRAAQPQDSSSAHLAAQPQDSSSAHRAAQ